MPKATTGTDNRLLFWCPGCDEAHGISVDGTRGWTWNGSLESPTVQPSILVRDTRKITSEEYDRIMAGEELGIPDRVCHSFVTDGKIHFLGDCTHELVGQTVELPDWDKQ